VKALAEVSWRLPSEEALAVACGIDDSENSAKALLKAAKRCRCRPYGGSFFFL